MNNDMMRAMVNERFGGPEVLKEKIIPIPKCGEDQVMVKVHSTSINTVDIYFRSGMVVFYGLGRLASGIRAPKKKLLGVDMSGEVVKVGSEVEGFEVGDQVFGGTGTGANAEFAISNPNRIATKPKEVSPEQAGVLPMAALSAFQGIREAGGITEGQEVLVYGASGGIGSSAVQLAKYFGAEVTGVASGRNEELVRSMGADRFIDYTKEDFTKQSSKYDMVFDSVGKFPLKKWKDGLKDNGVFVNAGAPSMQIMRFFIRTFGNRFRSKKIMSFNTDYNSQDLETIGKIAAEGQLTLPIEKTFPLEGLAAAHAHYETGRTRGKLHISVS